jgi:hypothetical protein
MQAEIDGEDPPTPVSLHGVNAAGEEDGNALAVEGRTIPWLQDDETEDVFGSWQVTHRDVIVLDHENRVFAIYNLSTHDLGTPANYEELKALLLEAGGSQ